MTNLPLIGGRLFGVPLLLEARRGAQMLHSLADRLNIETASLPALLDRPMPETAAMAGDGQAQARRPYALEDGIAIIRAHGPLAHRLGMIEAMCGMTSYQRIATLVQSAAADEAVRGILLDIDSPGGEVAGCFDLVPILRAAGEIKPVRAHANEFAASAAYAIAAGASRITMPRTGGVGSIGVLTFHVDRSGANEKAGRVVTAIHAGERKADWYDHAPLSEAGRASMQAEINRIWDIFANEVAASRPITAEGAKALQAAVLFGPEALKAGLADEILPLAEALEAFKADLTPTAKGETIMSTNPAGATTPKADAAPQGAAVDLSAALTRMASAAGVPELAVSLIEGGHDLESAATRIAEAKEIKQLCAKGMEQGLAADLSADLLTNNVSLENARTMITNLLAKQDEAIGGSAQVDSDTAKASAARRGKARVDHAGIWNDYRKAQTPGR